MVSSYLTPASDILFVTTQISIFQCFGLHGDDIAITNDRTQSPALPSIVLNDILLPHSFSWK